MRILNTLPLHDRLDELCYRGSPHQVSIFSGKMWKEEFFPQSFHTGETFKICADKYLDRPFERAFMYFQDRCPTWPEMCALKNFLWYPYEIVMQVHPRKSEYVNINPYALHLWAPTDVESLKTQHSILNLTVRALSMLQCEATSSEMFFKKIHFSGKTLVAIFGGKSWPTWEEVCSIKKHCFGEDKTALQFNICPELDLNSKHILLLWDAEEFPITLPPKEFV